MLSANFFTTDPLDCAANLIGTELVWGKCAGIVVETEAYLVEGDEASHTFSRPSTRAFVERNQPGAAYIYFNYGVHWMLNVLVKGGPRDGLILIRAIEPRRGLALMRKRRGVKALRRLCSGPGKLTQALAITKRYHEIDLSPTRRILSGLGLTTRSRSWPIRGSESVAPRIFRGASPCAGASLSASRCVRPL